MVCQPVTRTQLGPIDVGPHFAQGGELWWYLAVMTTDGVLDRPVGVQFSVFRKATGACTESSENLVVSTAAISYAGKYYQATRFFPTLSHHAALQAQPFTLQLDRAWGISSAAARSDDDNHTRQQLVASSSSVDDSLPLALNLSLSVPSASVLMADGGYADLNGTLLAHMSKPRQPAHGSVAFGGRRPVTVRGDFWLQHIWFTTPAGGTFPQWNWFNVQLRNGWDLQMVALGNGTHAPPGACLGDPGSYGNLVEPRSGRVIRLSVGAGADVCYRVVRRWTDTRCPAVRYPILSAISVAKAGAPKIELRVATLQEDNVVRPPFPRLSGYCAKGTYYEGGSIINGTFDGAYVDGVGFTEHEW